MIRIFKQVWNNEKYININIPTLVLVTEAEWRI